MNHASLKLCQEFQEGESTNTFLEKPDTLPRMDHQVFHYNTSDEKKTYEAVLRGCM